MLRLLSDENFNGDIIRGLLFRRANLDLLRVQEVGLEGADDPIILEWAAVSNRILLTHNRATMPDVAYARVAAGQPIPGVFVFNDRIVVRQAIEALLLVEDGSEDEFQIGERIAPIQIACFESTKNHRIHRRQSDQPIGSLRKMCGMT